MRRQISKRTIGSARDGTILVIALICLLLVTVLTASLTRTALLQREQVLRDEFQLQAEWLAEAGIDRAAVRLRSEPAYTGEEWRPAADVGEIPLGQVRIDVVREESDSGPTLVRINVTADVPADVVDRVRVERKSVVPALRDVEN